MQGQCCECLILSLAVRLRLFNVDCIVGYMWCLFYEQINDDDDLAKYIIITYDAAKKGVIYIINTVGGL